VKASDNVVPTPNTEATLSSSTFIYDIKYPTATVTAPAGGSIISALTSIAGTTTEEFIVSGVYITMRDDTTGLWWNQAGSTFSLNDAGKIFYLATPQSAGVWSNWTWTFDSQYLQTGRIYTINYYAIDAASNQQPTRTSVFTWDRTDPTSFVVSPANNSFIGVGQLTSITGTATDLNDIKDSGVEVSIQRLPVGEWWDSGLNTWVAPGSGPLYITTPATIDPPERSA
jgi:hypothetical protein